MGKPIAVHNPPNPFESAHVEWEGPAPDVKLEVFEERAKSILSENSSPDLGFRFSLNPYRGCFHGCTYCYARPTHHYLGFGAGTDFDRKIIAKINAPELLDKRLRSRRWGGDTVVFSGNTDCYQPLEATYELTRRCLEVCLEHENPIGVITKGNVIRRDIALLAELARRTTSRVTISVAFMDEAMRRRFDPFAPPAAARLETLRRLADAGIPVGVGVSPIIPGVNDSDVPEILERAKAAGADHAFITLLRLPDGTREHFVDRLRAELPSRAKKVENGLVELRRGSKDAMTDARFGRRMVGAGPRWDVVQQLFDTHARRLGLSTRPVERLTDDVMDPVSARGARGRGASWRGAGGRGAGGRGASEIVSDPSEAIRPARPRAVGDVREAAWTRATGSPGRPPLSHPRSSKADVPRRRRTEGRQLGWGF